MFHIARQLGRRRNEEIQFRGGIGRRVRSGTCIWASDRRSKASNPAAGNRRSQGPGPQIGRTGATDFAVFARLQLDRKSTRLNSSHSQISYAVFCLKKKKKT